MNNLDINKIREEFSFLKEENKNKIGKKIIYFDSGATSQRPDKIIDSITDYYKFSNANPGRSAHLLGVKSTDLVDKSRERVAKFLNSKANEIIFTRNATESINLIASTWAEENLKRGDEIITTVIEHHANFVPWQELGKKKDLKLNIVDIDENINLKIDDIYNFLNEKTKLVAITAASNVTAEILDIKNIIKRIREYNSDIKILVDATQYIPFAKIDVKEIDCDFLVFSGHKMYGPMGIGVLFVKSEILEEMKPYQYGGSMVEYVYLDETSYRDGPTKFEAGTINVAGIVGIKAAIDWMEDIGVENMRNHEDQLIQYLEDKIKDIENLEVYRSQNNSVPLLSFSFTDIHAHDVSSILDSFGIAVRAGHHCAMPIHTKLEIPASVRISLAVFNTKEEIDYLLDKLLEVRKIMGK